MADKSEVLIWITCRNYERFCHAARDSALEQTHPCFVKEVHDHCGRGVGVGPAKMRNQCVNYVDARSASGWADYVIFLDADDRIPADYVEKLLKVAKGDRCVVACDAEMTGEETGRIRVQRPITLRSMLEGNSVHVSALIPFEVFDRFRFDESLPSHEDWDLWCKMLAAGVEFRYCADAQLTYTRHSTGRSASTRDRYAEIWRTIRSRYSRETPRPTGALELA